MTALHVPLLAGTWLLLLAGVAKAYRPEPAHRAIRTLGGALRPGAASPPVLAVRLLGAAEVTSALVVLAVPSRGVLWVLGAWYAAFAVFVVAALATGAPLASCGCFGAADTPPSVVHVAIDAGLAALAVAAATDASFAPLRDALDDSSGAVLAGSVALAVAGLAAFGALRPRRATPSVPRRPGTR